MPGQAGGQAGGQVGVQVGRTLTFAVLATCLALLAHATAGGAVPGAGALLLVALLSGTAGAWLAVRRPSVVGAAAGLGVVQALTHLLFMAGAPMTHGSGTAMTASHVAAVGVTAWLLTRGERAAAAVLTRLRVALPADVVVDLPVASQRPAPQTQQRPGCGRVVVRHLLRRGPPGSLPAVA